MADHSYDKPKKKTVAEKIKARAKQVPKNKARDLAQTIANYKATAKAQGRKYTAAEEKHITSGLTDTLERQDKAANG